MVNAKKSKINLTFIMKPNSLLSVTNTATNMGKHFIFPFFIFAWQIMIEKKCLLYNLLGCDVIAILTTNSCDLDLCSPFYFMSIRSIIVVRKVRCFRKYTFHYFFQNRIKFTFMTMRILYMHVTMNLMHTIVYLDT